MAVFVQKSPANIYKKIAAGNNQKNVIAEGYFLFAFRFTGATSQIFERIAVYYEVQY
jgi:hypothetical protein